MHDSIEDTDTTILEVEENFGSHVANAILTLTKNEALTKEEQMNDSLQRIKKLPNKVSAVMMVDRITNLQEPHSHWDMAKRIKYRAAAQLIWDELKEGNRFLAKRSKEKILEYEKYVG
ncbi:MAG: hypothetical protein IPP27_02395 [Bacteroidetes bacterium]|nr:hypothetical protein [Bacteroidota bacterium]